ncbi:SDR family oxidoreductase [Thalassotalea sp. 1_MG-2023]|uniref:SDR family oxidoreductase n=1 Tax=Thalassotalea sp. 1_MG-2023 TaxID=3062680 RepID=UPI0026E2D2B6|nr:SDR family oxidoreductase [Thalassotalea sp. 1_MG-2023]MDO6428424.1 SDR family oxidoreductase [Thalassotalea sp. 1_MG-2023]
MKNTVVITGANRGIGLAMATIFAEQGDNVIALCRQSSAALDALNVKVVNGVDVATEQGLTVMAEALSNESINVLICNAGILRDEQLGQLNTATIKEQFDVNALAPLLVVERLLPQLVTGSKIAMITSRMGSIADNGSGGRYGYRMSKAALNAASMSLSKDLAPQDISVGVYHPGFVQTEMVNMGGDISANEAAGRIVKLIEQQSMAETGVFKHSNGEVLPW